MYIEADIPLALRAYVRRILFADESDDIDVTSDVRATGYMFLGFVHRGSAQANIGDRLEMEVNGSGGRVHVSGQVVAKDITIRFLGPIGHVLVEFTGLGSCELLGIYGTDVIDRCCPPETLNPTLAATFSGQTDFKDGQSSEQALNAIINALTKLARNPTPAPAFLHRALARIETQAGQINLTDLCCDLGVSQRHLTRQFTKYVGQSPKRFCRIKQLNRALQAMIDEDANFLAGIASDAGFSDQSHFNRVFRQHLLTNPLEFLNSDQHVLKTFLAERRDT